MTMKNNKYDISAFYFPNFHKGDKHNEQWHGEGWTEWELMKHATPRFEGHDMPKVPLWGYEDESDAEVMEKKIRAAAEYGITNMLFDWYWYADGLFLNKALDEGFLKSRNADDIKFSIMWANHDWDEIHPISRAYIENPKRELPWKISEECFFEAIDYIIENYFKRSNYYRIEGKLFFSIYEINKFINNFGSTERCRDVIKEIRRRVKEAGLGEVHMNAIVWGTKILMGESNNSVGGKVLRDIGFDSVTSYVWIHEHAPDNFPATDYAEFRELCEKDFARLTEKFKGIPYYPNVTCGWDPSPRTVQTDKYGDLGYPFSRILVNNTPAEFEKALRNVKKMLDESDLKTKMFTVNAWNEWTEGSYLEPDTRDGYGKLEAIKKVFIETEE